MNTLVNSIIQDLAEKSCAFEVLDTSRWSMGFLGMKACSSILVDLPHFFVTQADINDFEIVYIGPNDYCGLVECCSLQVTALVDVQREMQEITGTMPRVILADLKHLGQDRPAALQILADYFTDEDMWDEQVIISVESIGAFVPWKQSLSRLHRHDITAAVSIR